MMVLVRGATACASDYMLQYNTRPRQTAMPVLCVVVLRLCCLFSLSLCRVLCVCVMCFTVGDGAATGSAPCPCWPKRYGPGFLGYGVCLMTGLEFGPGLTQLEMGRSFVTQGTASELIW